MVLLLRRMTPIIGNIIYNANPPSLLASSRCYKKMGKRQMTDDGGEVPKGKKGKLAPPPMSPKELWEAMTLPEELEGSMEFKPVSSNKEGIPWNLKIVSWNVNGIRAVIKKNKLGYFKSEDADIICLQETKCDDGDLPPETSFYGYHRYVNCATKKGYSGTAIYSKVEPLSIVNGIGVAEHDDAGRAITAEYETFYLVNTYVPNSGKKVVNLPYRREWNTALLSYIQGLDEKKPVILTGDLNVAHNEIDLKNDKTNHKNAGFTDEEREDFGKILDAGFVDSFRHLYPEQEAYTFWTFMMNARGKNVGWRLDYFVVSQRLMGAVCDSLVREKVMGSDHCPVMLLMAEGSGTKEEGNGVAVDKVEGAVDKVDKVEEDQENVKQSENLTISDSEDEAGDVKQGEDVKEDEGVKKPVETVPEPVVEA